ncbi:MAG: hypothetical protein JSW40_01340 [Candidatus Omnitrophota bacterium]|nr:MAG: hypothetical protein JSW40_01340 [Candidatus Omnitrophota bacterium]
MSVAVYDFSGCRGFKIVCNEQDHRVYAVEAQDLEGKTICSGRGKPVKYKYYYLGEGGFDKFGRFQISFLMPAHFVSYTRNFFDKSKASYEIRLNVLKALGKPDFITYLATINGEAKEALPQ